MDTGATGEPVAPPLTMPLNSSNKPFLPTIIIVTLYPHGSKGICNGREK